MPLPYTIQIGGWITLLEKLVFLSLFGLKLCCIWP